MSTADRPEAVLRAMRCVTNCLCVQDREQWEGCGFVRVDSSRPHGKLIAGKRFLISAATGERDYVCAYTANHGSVVVGLKFLQITDVALQTLQSVKS